MPYCPKCGKETGNAKFCPECGATQGIKEAAPTFSSRKKEPFNSWIGAVLCCCCCPLATLGYYFISEPDENSLNQTFIRIGALCGIGIIFFIILTVLLIMLDFNIFDL